MLPLSVVIMIILTFHRYTPFFLGWRSILIIRKYIILYLSPQVPWGQAQTVKAD